MFDPGRELPETNMLEEQSSRQSKMELVIADSLVPEDHLLRKVHTRLQLLQ